MPDGEGRKRIIPYGSENWICMKKDISSLRLGGSDKGFEYAESARLISVFADRRLRVDEPPPTAGH
jgi:hypothetical protein